MAEKKKAPQRKPQSKGFKSNTKNAERLAANKQVAAIILF